MVNTIKFSQFASAGNLPLNSTTVGLSAGTNAAFNNPWVFLPPGSTASRPTPGPSVNYLLRFNTDTQTYEFYNAVAGMWETIAGSISISTVTGTFNQVLVNGTTGIAQPLPVTLTLPQDIATSSTPVFQGVQVDNIFGANGLKVIQIGSQAAAINFFGIGNSATGGGPVISAIGGDADVEFTFQTQGLGQIGFNSLNPTPIIINSGTALQHSTALIFANTAATRNVTFQDSDGTVAYLSDIPAGSPSALTKVDDTNVTLTLGGTPATSLLEAVSLTLGWTGTLSGIRGGTGVNNGANTATFAGNLNFANSFTTSGNFAVTQTYTGATNVTFPTSGTLATTAGTVSSITGTASQVLANGTSGSAQTGAVTLTLPQNIATSSSPEFTAVKTAAILDSNGVDVLQFQTAASAVNWLLIGNSATAGGPILASVGSDSNINMTLLTKGTGQIILDSVNTTTPLVINSGTGLQHTTNFSFANTAASRTVTFQDADGTVAFTGQVLLWNDVSGTSQAAAVNNGYIISNAAQTTVTIPATAAEGSVFGVQGKGAAGWILKMNTGQVCHFGSSATSSAGTLTSTNQWDSVQIVCVTANTTFAVISAIGNLTVA